MAKHKISKRRRKLIDELCEAAKHWGWQEDRGNGASVDGAKKDFETCRQALINSIINLEVKAKNG